MTKSELKKWICSWIDERKEQWIASGEELLRMPEISYREKRTSEYVRRALDKCGLPIGKPFAITGVCADLETGRPGPRVGILGELDAIIVPAHPFADPETQAAHACGHHAALNAMLGCAAVLSQPEVLQELSGAVRFCGCPSEECQDQPYIASLIAAKKLRFFGGKSEMIAEGIFADIDIAMMLHAGDRNATTSGFNGFVMKQLIFQGRSSHAGASPEEGINALSMLRSAMNLLDAQRDTFRDEDHVRIHGYVPEGGKAVNVVPDHAILTLQVRGGSPAAIRDASAKVDRCVFASAMAFGGTAEVRNLFGFMPLVPYAELDTIHENNVSLIAGNDPFVRGVYRCSSTDMGDVSMIRPSLHPYFQGFSGTPHRDDFLVSDPVKAYVDPCKFLALNTVDLLYGDASQGQQIAALKTPLDCQQYLEDMERFSSTRKA